MQNAYLQEVVAGTELVEEALRPRRSTQVIQNQESRGSASLNTVNGGLDVRVTGWWRWKTVVVPPNAFVVHTRRGVEKPLHCGLGVSFKFNPFTDSFLVVPAAMQTIIVNANCICSERQGIMVQAYVQWIIDDFQEAYSTLDFSDPVEPMRVTNMQLRQQAEATIKDTVATMSIDAVLSDKQPIIKELTRRLREVAEGDNDHGGLGLRIVTVQIKEAVVSSASLWETLQRGFRAERSKEARLAELATQSVVRERENAESLKADRLCLEKDEAVRRLKLESDARAFDSEQEEQSRRAKLKAENATKLATHRRTVMEQTAAIETLKQVLDMERRTREFEMSQAEERQRVSLDAERIRVENDISPQQLRARLIECLPTIAERLPKPESVRIYGQSSGDQLNHLIGSVADALERFGPASINEA